MAIGLEMDVVRDLDTAKGVCTLEFRLWLLSAENVGLADLVMVNLVGAPDEQRLVSEKRVQGKIYRRYRVQGTFGIDFLSGRDFFNKHFVGLQLRPAVSGALRLVLDKKGMGVGDEQSFLHRLRSNRVLLVNGWTVERAEFLHGTLARPTLGDPAFRENGEATFQTLSIGVWMEKDELAIRGMLSPGVSLLLVGCGLIAALAVAVAQKKTLFRHFPGLVWPAKAVLSFVLLVGTEAVLLDWAAGWPFAYAVDAVKEVFDILWWVVPAYLLTRALVHYFWRPLEARAGRAVPDVVKHFVAFLVYLLAFFGIVAFVYDQKITSLLATSGVVAMILGLAIQINISNIFSGIALNIEQPFRVGDWVKIGGFEEGVVTDITWRTTRIKTRAENITAIPNSVVTDALIENYCAPSNVFRQVMTIHVAPEHNPERVTKILYDAAMSAEGISHEIGPYADFAGLTEWAADYWVTFYGDDYAGRWGYWINVSNRVWVHLHRAGIKPAIRRQEIHTFKGREDRGEEAIRPITLLSEIDVFRPFPDEAKETLSRGIARRAFRPDESIVRQGEEGDSLFLIVEGSVTVSVQGEDGGAIEVARLGAGSFFGEMSLLTGEPRSASIVAKTYCVVYELAKDKLQPLLESDSELMAQISEVLTQRKMATAGKQNAGSVASSERRSVYSEIFDKIKSFFKL